LYVKNVPYLCFEIQRVHCMLRMNLCFEIQRVDCMLRMYLCFEIQRLDCMLRMYLCFKTINNMIALFNLISRFY
jgi:hypothetical protein